MIVLLESQRLFELFGLLNASQRQIIAALIYELLPDDIATPDDIAAIEEGDAEFLRGETVSFSDINWG